MHLEKHNIQTRGFHNLVDENGNAIGFQFRVKTNVYKGQWLSQIRVGDVTVDGITYPREEQTWEINGIEYTPDEMLEIGDQRESTYWQLKDAAVVKVKKPGGLSQGYHTVSIVFGVVPAGRGIQKSDLGDINFTKNNERRLIIV